MDADGTDAVKLTSGFGDIKPAFSPDGSRIVYASYRLDAEAELPARSTDLWIMDADGSNQTLLLDGELGVTDPDFSPDGTRIVFTHGWHIWIMNADGSDPVQLTTQESNGGPSFSPDGTMIVYGSDVNGALSGAAMNVWVMNADGSSAARLTDGFTGADTPTFSPDGTRIVFATTRSGNTDLYVINANGSGEVRLTAHAAADVTPRWGQ
jgi:TolB protein